MSIKELCRGKMLRLLLFFMAIHFQFYTFNDEPQVCFIRLHVSDFFFFSSTAQDAVIVDWPQSTAEHMFCLKEFNLKILHAAIQYVS